MQRYAFSSSPPNYHVIFFRFLTNIPKYSCVLCGIIAIADKLGIDATLKSGCERATQELLDGVYWFNYRPMQKDMATWRTPQMVHAVGGITDEMVDAFKQYIAGVQPVASVGGSNGAAHSLTHWDGSEVTNGWHAPTRPNFLNYSRKKGKGIGYKYEISSALQLYITNIVLLLF